MTKCSSHRETFNICLMSNQYGDFIISKTVVDGQCAGQKTQMLRVSYENTYIIELKSHI
jgi:hypothetical protein